MEGKAVGAVLLGMIRAARRHPESTGEPAILHNSSWNTNARRVFFP